jgi:hypothetical protein
VDDLIYKGGDSALKQIDGMEEYIFVSVVGIVEVLRTERGVEVPSFLSYSFGISLSSFQRDEN